MIETGLRLRASFLLKSARGPSAGNLAWASPEFPVNNKT